MQRRPFQFSSLSHFLQPLNYTMRQLFCKTENRYMGEFINVVQRFDGELFTITEDERIDSFKLEDLIDCDISDCGELKYETLIGELTFTKTCNSFEFEKLKSAFSKGSSRVVRSKPRLHKLKLPVIDLHRDLYEYLYN